MHLAVGAESIPVLGWLQPKQAFSVVSGEEGSVVDMLDYTR